MPMNILFLHRHFPGQYRHIAAALAAEPGNRVVFVTTEEAGALPGVVALALGRAMGARTVWIDSVANAAEMSLSGRLARRVAHLWLTQWEHVARDSGAEYAGSVL